ILKKVHGWMRELISVTLNESRCQNRISAACKKHWAQLGFSDPAISRLLFPLPVAIPHLRWRPDVRLLLKHTLRIPEQANWLAVLFFRPYKNAICLTERSLWFKANRTKLD